MTLFADDIRARAGCNGITTLFSRVVTALQPCDQVLMQCDKLKTEKYGAHGNGRKVVFITTRQFSIVKTC